MEKQVVIGRHMEKWKKLLMRMNMIFIIVIASVEIGMYRYLDSIGKVWCSWKYYSMFYVVFPFLINSLAWSIGMIFLKTEKLPPAKRYMVPIVCMSVICFSMVYFHCVFYVLFSIFGVPIILSGMFGSRKMTIYVGILNMSLFWLAVLLPHPEAEYDTMLLPSNIFLAFLLLIMIFFITNIVIEYNRGVMENLQDTYKSKEEFRKRLWSDMQTGILNHYAYTKLAEEGIQRYKDHSESFTAAMLDIDYFKKVNDTYGHGAGDIVLKDLAQYLLKELRNYPASVCRYGGEEFMVLFSGMREVESYYIMERIRKGFEKIVHDFGETSCSATFSCGIMECSDDVNSERDLFERVDQALYAAKRNGRNQCVKYESIAGK